ncbi:MAG: LPXTG cell wall anchor domain-containing protein [Flavobacteriales bacterium]|nr:LPXTG cell wall anchor domain-containing protein [Flavobacteriales bacterium]
MKKWISLLLVFAFAVLLSQDVDAQCAMCKLNAESASEADNAIGKGINNGILYLMGIPYGLLLIGGLVFFRKKLTNFRG